MLPDFAVSGDDPQAPAFVRDVWLAVHSDMKRAPAIRATIEALSDTLKAVLARA
jgi:DNA-binding transcriptional LysR family regulator